MCLCDVVHVCDFFSRILVEHAVKTFLESASIFASHHMRCYNKQANH